MKFATNLQKLTLITLILCLTSLSFSLRLKLHQTGVEQQDIAMNIYNNISEYVASSDINIHLVQNLQLVNGTNRYVGYWETKILGVAGNITSVKFLDQVPNFGRQIDTKSVNIDFRYILGCNFDDIEESNSLKVKFQMMSKESTSQHVYNIELIFPASGNKLDEIKKYFNNIMKICISTQETANIIKGQLAGLLKENLAIKKKKVKKIKMQKGKKKLKKGLIANSIAGSDFNSTQIFKETGGNGTDPNPVSTINNPSNPVIKPAKIYVDDITDPSVKSNITKLVEVIRVEKDKIKRYREEKDRLFKRAGQLMDRMDKDNQQLTVIEPKNREYAKHSVSANSTIAESMTHINTLNLTNQILISNLTLLNVKKSDHEKIIKSLEENYNNIKADLNSNIEEEKTIRKSISDLEARSSVDTETLTAIENKKKVMLEKIKDLTAEIKKDGDDIDTNQKNLNLVQTNFNNLVAEKKKIEQHIQELKNKLDDLRKKENDIKKNIDPKIISTMETQQQTTITSLSDLEKVLTKKKDAVMAIIDPLYAEIVEKAFEEITNKDNFDPESYLRVIKTLPPFIWQPPASDTKAPLVKKK
jgi:hypothetical protein